MMQDDWRGPGSRLAVGPERPVWFPRTAWRIRLRPSRRRAGASCPEPYNRRPSGDVLALLFSDGEDTVAASGDTRSWARSTASISLMPLLEVAVESPGSPEVVKPVEHGLQLATGHLAVHASPAVFVLRPRVRRDRLTPAVRLAVGQHGGPRRENLVGRCVIAVPSMSARLGSP